MSKAERKDLDAAEKLSEKGHWTEALYTQLPERDQGFMEFMQRLMSQYIEPEIPL